MYFIILIFVFAFVYYKILKPHNFWKEKNVPYIQPLPFIGNIGASVTLQKSFPENIDALYQAAGNKRYLGFYELLKPVLLVKDIDLLKKVVVKDFEYFPNHSSLINADVDPVASRSLFAVHNSEGWHDLRAIMSPAFTGSKMKLMYELIEEYVDKILNYFPQTADEMDTIDLFHTMTKISIDLMATLEFGFNCDSFQNPQNEFYLKGKQVANIGGIKSLFAFGTAISPILHKIFDIRLFDQEVSDYFTNLLHESIAYREKHNIYRPDIIHLLLEAKKAIAGSDISTEDTSSKKTLTKNLSKLKNNVVLTNDNIVSQAMLFVFAGSDLTAQIFSYAIYELTMHPDIQNRLREEIHNSIKANQGKLSYDSITKMKYLDCVISEVLRLRPPTGATERMVDKPYIIEPELPEEERVELPPKLKVWIPILSIHMDPDHYPNPTKFDPDRFNDENKHNLKSAAFLPFGAGPRICIAYRMILLEVKLLTCKLIKNFEFVPIPKTPKNITYKSGNFRMIPNEKLWVGVKQRTR